jgi:hypothetical protein
MQLLTPAVAFIGLFARSNAEQQQPSVTLSNGVVMPR